MILLPFIIFHYFFIFIRDGDMQRYFSLMPSSAIFPFSFERTDYHFRVYIIMPRHYAPRVLPYTFCFSSAAGEKSMGVEQRKRRRGDDDRMAIFFQHIELAAFPSLFQSRPRHMRLFMPFLRDIPPSFLPDAAFILFFLTLLIKPIHILFLHMSVMR